MAACDYRFPALLCAGLLVSASSAAAAPADYFKITVIDADNGRGVPLVELRTVNNIRHVTDSNGVVAFREPGLMGKSVFFHVRSHGYEFPKDGFGYRGRRLSVKAGGSAVLKIKRINIAERLYRVTGAGIYRDSVLTGVKVPIKNAVLNARVLGQDSVVNAVYKGRIHWFWGDTNRPGYPLGNFHVPGATSLLPGKGGLDPERGVDLKYFVGKDGFARPTAQMPGKGPTWIGGLVVLKDGTGSERLFAQYVKVAKGMRVYEKGLVEFKDAKQRFEKVRKLDLKAPAAPGGHPFLHKVNGVEYIYFNKGFPLTRVKATPKALAGPTTYQTYSPFKKGSRADSIVLERDEAGRLLYSWKTDTIPFSQKLQRKLIAAGKMKAGEGLLHLQDVVTGKTVMAHGGSVYWNAFRKRWVMIVLQSFGTSLLGEIWFAEANSPVGPWTYARKIVTHDKYSFYNPKQHPMFDKQGGRVIFFEGTYTNMFSGNPDQTPRYNYNQILYRLDLADRRLALPVPVFRGKLGLSLHTEVTQAGNPGEISFYALDRPARSSIPVFASTDAKSQTLTLQAPTGSQALFHALPVDSTAPPETTVPLYEYRHDRTRHSIYSTRPALAKPGFKRSKQPLCRVWRNPSAVRFPIDKRRETGPGRPEGSN